MLELECVVFPSTQLYRISQLDYSPTELDALCLLVKADSKLVLLSYWEENGIGVVEVAPLVGTSTVTQDTYSYHHTSVPSIYKEYVVKLINFFASRKDYPVLRAKRKSACFLSLATGRKKSKMVI